MAATEHDRLLYIWLDASPDSSGADTTLEDIPDVPDINLIAEALLAGHFGRYLPGTIRYATHAEPAPNKVKSIDTARLLRDRGIPHRRRYEIVLPDDHQ